MIVSIMQPAYLPWLGYFHRLWLSDIHIVLDHVQISKKCQSNFTNRNRIRTKNGWCWMTVPIKTKGKFGDLNINRVKISDHQHWSKKHWKTILTNYIRAPYFSKYEVFFQEIYGKNWDNLLELNNETTAYLQRLLGIKTPLLFSSKMNINDKKSDLILKLCKEVNAKVYLSGPFGKNYIQEERFTSAGIKVIYHDYKHPIYPQAFDGFEPYMSAIDLLFNCGPESVEIVKKIST